jgi:hypothetical protein
VTGRAGDWGVAAPVGLRLEDEVERTPKGARPRPLGSPRRASHAGKSKPPRVSSGSKPSW